MKLTLIPLAVLLVCCPAVSSLKESHQQQAHHSVAQCRADVAAWNKEEDDGPKDKDSAYELSYLEILQRQKEVFECMHLDGQDGPDGVLVRTRTSYLTISGIYTTALMVRYSDFIARHDLLEKFMDDDKKGLR